MAEVLHGPAVVKGRVLVTGAAGFLGSNLIPQLLNRGYTVTGLDNFCLGSRERIEAYSAENFTFMQADVCDPVAVQSAAAGVQYIVHFAELKIPRYTGSFETLEVNVAGTENVLQAAVQQKARVVMGSTDEVYGKNLESPLHEESALVLGQTDITRWSFAASKMMAEHLCFAYREKHGVPVTILRYFGGYGVNQAIDWQGGPQSQFITSSLRGEPLPIHGDGLQIRTFTHVNDLVNGTILAMESTYSDGEILNIASQDALSIINLAYLIWRLVRRPEKPVLEFVPYTDFSRKYEDVRRRIADISKARYLIGYEPAVALEAGLRQTIQWQAQSLG
jgi:UDP-glucose 4-epimerase